MNDTSTANTGEPIAIVGMAGRFPGAEDIDELWELLLACGDAIRPVPSERWDADAPLDGSKRIQGVGGFLDGVDRFDAALFGISPREAADIDPQQRIMLETVWRAMEDGGIPLAEVRGHRVGVYMGASWHDYEILRRQRQLGASQHSLVGTALDVIASRVSYVLGLTGPSMTVETGCSSALVALDLAVRAIRSGDVESAIVGGVNLLLAPDVSIGLTHFGGLSQTGRCAAFGAGADGFVRGEGVAAVYLKPLRAARADGDPVRAVVFDSVVNNDGGGDSLVTPNPAGQRDLLRRAYRTDGLDLGDLAYVEAHGTGTGRGDPIEARALGEILGADRPAEHGPLPIGSVKTNIGHLEAAAGIAGLVKAVLCLEHRRVPPSLHSETLNPEIPFDALNLRVVREPIELPADRPCYIGVNSFGWGGTNAHVVLRSADAVAEDVSAGPALGFLPVSAHTPDALRHRCRDIADLLDSEPERSGAVIAALARRGTAHPLRSAVLGEDPVELAAALRAHAEDPSARLLSVLSGRAADRGEVAFVFPGQGGQWHGLAGALYGVDPAFTDALDACCAALAPHVDWDAKAIVTGAGGAGWLDRVDQVQPVLWALACGIAAMWRRAGIEPDVVIGHSQGEIAAATVAGLLSMADAATIVARRSAALRTVAGTGRMLAVDLGIDEIASAVAGFEDLVALAVHNGPRSCVLSGDTDAIEALREILTAEGAYCRLVNVDYASHSPRMSVLRPRLLSELAGITPRPGRVEMMSTVSVRKVTPRDLTADYWIENLCRRVRFAEAMSALYDDGVTHVVEISPHPVLLPAAEQLAATRPRPPAVLPSLYRDSDPVAEMNRGRARAYVAGLLPFADVEARDVARLPRYPFQPESHWLPSAIAPESRATESLRVEVAPSSLEPGAWLARVGDLSGALGWLADHRVGDAVLAPAAMMTALVIAAVRARFGAWPAALCDLRFVDTLVLGVRPVRVEVSMRDDIAARTSFEVVSLTGDADGWVGHARGQAERSAASTDAPEAFPAGLLDADPVPVADFYRDCERRGLHYGPRFQVIRELRVRGDGARRVALSRVVLGDQCRAQTGRAELHTALLDGVLQTALALFDDERTMLPAGIDELRFYGEPAGYIDAAWAYASRRSETQVDIHLFVDDHTPLARIGGLHLHPIEGERTGGRRSDREFILAFRSVPREQRTLAGTFVLSGAAHAHAELSVALRDAGGPAVSVEPDTEVPSWAGKTVVFLAPTGRDGLDAQRNGLTELATLVRRFLDATATPARLVVVTANAQAAEPADRPDPGGALFWGFVRVLRREHPELSAELIDLDPAGGAGVAECAAELLAAPGDDQVVLRRGGRYVGRLEQGTRADGDTSARPLRAAAQPFLLRSTPGRFWDGLSFRPLDIRAPGVGEVLVEVEAASLNFMDVMKATGAYPDSSAGSELLGAECAGVVRAVGPGVGDRAIGDRVVACGFGSLASHLTVRADHTAVVPAGMSAATAAALPIVTATAWYALVRLAAATADDTILIHSAAGGLGLAAIGVARSVGATVIATAGTERRRVYLRDTCGIEHVFDSRSPDWPDDVREVTGGRGVDVVLNSLAGAAIDRGLDVLAEDGRFLEVGKKDIYADRRIGLGAFAKGITVSAVDLAGLMTRRPERFATVLRETWRQVVSKRLAAPPVTVYDFADGPRALRQLADGTHVGKLVLTRPGTVDRIVPEPMPDGRFRGGGTYLITGGHGALGRSLAAHLLAHGAGAVALVSRGTSDPGPRSSDPSHDSGRDPNSVVVREYRADVADHAALAAVLDAVRAELPPLRGVFHAAGVLDDATVATVSAEQIERVLRPKIDGARHLDALTADDPLDAFVLFSSAAALIGNPGQSAYAAANAYLDALATARRRDGRPGTSVQWGPFEDIGLAATRDNRGARLAARGLRGISAADAWKALDCFVSEDRPVVGYLSLNRRQWFDAYPDCAAQSSWRALRDSAEAGGRDTGAHDFLDTLARATGDERHRLVHAKVTEIAAQVLRMPPAGLDGATPLKTLGLDSLMSLEMRNKLEFTFRLELSATVLWTYGTTKALSGAIGERLAAATPTREEAI
ncbi:phthiocerol/phenolphthiocerol synthesis type-I polyketide synthase C [Nocardia amikacinitolerans]|uniref:type I polyketide synthase n=1 Tax=Nocardia amikacinitolerans TaxID=756689 RepID=UPI0020A2E457|nr:type I polyketide synthase [Nocardia amikacinitolerans]MCP2294159.1 phthiocerol/phenolphthiocerol synthesis type-I polyketide synthase C [Nocardia amikacinitolerans]